MIEQDVPPGPAPQPAVRAVPFGPAAGAGREPLSAAIGLAVLGVGLIRAGSRGGFLAFLAVAAFVLLRLTTLPVYSRLLSLAVVLAVVVAVVVSLFALISLDGMFRWAVVLFALLVGFLGPSATLNRKVEEKKVKMPDEVVELAKFSPPS